MMRYLTLMLVPVLFLTGCGYNPEKPVYDTVANPDGYPKAALALLDGVESGQLGNYDTIVSTFGELYMEHTELLDNDSWREVIQRLGSKFRYFGDRYTEEGIGSYLSACQYYRLAAFARVGDLKAQHRAALFETWWKALKAGVVDSSLAAPNGPTVRAAITATRYFALGDSLHREFFDHHLRELIGGRLIASGRLTASTFAELSELDRILLAFAGFDVGTPETKQAAFLEPRIDLITMHLTRLDSTSYDIEAYFMPREPIPGGLRMVLRIETAGADTLHPDFSRDLHVSHVELVPEPAPSTWSPQQLAALKTTFHYSAAPGPVFAGLAVRSTNGVKYLPLSGTDETLFAVDSNKVELR